MTSKSVTRYQEKDNRSFVEVTNDTNAFGSVVNVRYVNPSHTPSWKVFGKGHASVDITVGTYSTSLQANSPTTKVCLDVTESYEAEGGRDVVKRTLVSINEVAARKLYAALKEKFGDDQT
jgi:hypothetical protein